MYSREESQKIKREFWVAFADKYPRKWLLYDTKIKDFSFKFYIDNKKAQVALAIEHRNEEKRNAYFEKIKALQSVLLEDFKLDLLYDKNYLLDNTKIISQIWIEIHQVGFSNKATWHTIFDFFNDKMLAFEQFYSEYDTFIQDIDS